MTTKPANVNRCVAVSVALTSPFLAAAAAVVVATLPPIVASHFRHRPRLFSLMCANSKNQVCGITFKICNNSLYIYIGCAIQDWR